MKILLTGVTGYIGNAVMHHLAKQGHDVHGLVRKEAVSISDSVHYHLLENDNIRDIVSAVKPDVVVHIASLFLAAHQYSDIEKLIESNITFPTKLLDAMDCAGVTHFINTGTSWQHYDSEPYNPVNLYAATKQSFEDIIKYYVEAKGFSCLTLKIYDSYGPGDTRGKLVSLFDRLAENQESLDMSPGEQHIDLVHISDICNAYNIAIQMIMKQQPGYQANYGLHSNKSFSLKELAAIYERSNNCNIHINWGGREYRPREVMKPASNLERLPGWEPSVELSFGLNRVNRK
ncbi:NAD-dependent epimerase/dehydratase family protein [Kosakonia sacchari]